jgi:hypothetical protein
MRNVILVISIFFLSITSCNRSDYDETKYTNCLQSQIDNILIGTPRSPRSNIKKYNYDNQIVYVIEINDIADEQFNVVDKQCNVVCVFGGINGNQNSTCVNFESAQYIETVWTDPR